MNPERDFGIWLRQLRTARDLTQEALAEMVGCATQTVRSFESGRRRPSRDMAARLADTLAVSPTERNDFLRLARAPLTLPSANADVRLAAPLIAPVPLSSALPTSTDALIGRSGDLQRLRHALLDTPQRLVTLLGPGGIGKTRLALQAAADLAPHFSQGAAVVALAAIADPANVAAAIADALGCPRAGIYDPTAALLAFLRERELLLVLDNLEHLLAEAFVDQLSDLLTAMLRGAPKLRLLVTSRERLRLLVEHVIELGGLGLPDDDQPNRIAHAEAVLLFVERARRITGDFALTPANQVAVAQICRRLDGLPLALELAAAQVFFLPPATLLARLDQVLPLLEGGARDLPARQRTMRAAIGWSHRLLQAKERLVFERLGVLVGNFSLAAAEAVGAGDQVSSAQVLGLLRRLVDQSLVVRDSAPNGEARYRLLEPMRQYALEQLETQPTQADDARNRHTAFFLALIEQTAPQMHTPQQKPAFHRLLAHLLQEYPNAQAIINRALARNDFTTVVRMGWALYTFWWFRGQQREAKGWMEAVLAHSSDLAPNLRAQTLIAYAMTLYGDQSEPYLQANQQAFQLFEQLEDLYGQAQALMGISLARFQAGELDEAAALLHRTQALTRQLGDTWLTTQVASTLGLIWSHQGQHDQAIVCVSESLATSRATGDTWNESLALFNLAMIKQMQGDIESAAQFHRAWWLVHEPESGAVNGAAVSYCLESLAMAASARGDAVRAARTFGAAAALRDIAGHMAAVLNRTPYEHAIDALRRQLGSSAFAAAWAEGRAMSMMQAVAYALEESDSV